MVRAFPVPNFLPCLILGTDTFTLLLCPIFLVPIPPLDKETSSDLLLQLYLIGKIRTRKQLVSLLASCKLGHEAVDFQAVILARVFLLLWLRKRNFSENDQGKDPLITRVITKKSTASCQNLHIGTTNKGKDLDLARQIDCASVVFRLPSSHRNFVP